MSPIKDFYLRYEALNEENTISEGDTIRGTVTFTLKNDTKIKRLQIKVKGDANVKWTTGSGDSETTHSAHRRYFKLKEYLIGNWELENTEGTMLPKGVHRFKFSFRIPQGQMPSSFKGKHGSIVYMLEAKISRSWRLPSTVKKEICFVSRSLFRTARVMCPQSGSLDKKIGIFSKGLVQMSATVNKSCCSPGNTLSIVGKVCNSSSKKMSPKFSLHQIIVYSAGRARNTNNQTLRKMVGDTIAPNSSETVSCKMTVPPDAIHTLHHCDIISVEYYIKFSLDISFAFDREVVFPLVVIPSSSTALQPRERAGPYPQGAVGGPSYDDFPPPTFPGSSSPVRTGRVAVGYPAPNPSQLPNVTSSYTCRWPRNAAPYASSTAAVRPPSVQHPAATQPPQFQEEEEPPSYTSLFGPFHDPLGRSAIDDKT